MKGMPEANLGHHYYLLIHGYAISLFISKAHKTTHLAQLWSGVLHLLAMSSLLTITYLC
jgi:hypothetical protein